MRTHHRRICFLGTVQTPAARVCVAEGRMYFLYPRIDRDFEAVRTFFVRLRSWGGWSLIPLTPSTIMATPVPSIAGACVQTSVASCGGRFAIRFKNIIALIPASINPSTMFSTASSRGIPGFAGGAGIPKRSYAFLNPVRCLSAC